MKIRSDRRCREARRDPTAERMVRDGAAALRDAEIRTARGLARVHRKRMYLLSGCSSAVDYGVRAGLSPRRALTLLRTGMALEADRNGEGERRLRAGSITTDDAAEVGKLYAAAQRAEREAAKTADPGDAARALATNPVVRPGEDWFARAGEVPTRVLRKEIHERIEGHRTEERVRTISIAAKESAIEMFQRTQKVASRRAEMVLSDGQTLAAVCDDYLTRHDPLRTKRRARRVGPTSKRPRDRYVPAEVFAAVLERSGDRCEVAGCGHRIFLENAHIVPHAENGDREVRDILRLCDAHHPLLDAGRIRFLAWEGESGSRQRPAFVDAVTGEVLGAVETGPQTRVAARPIEVRERAPPYVHHRPSSTAGPRESRIGQVRTTIVRRRPAAGTCPARTRRCGRARPRRRRSAGWRGTAGPDRNGPCSCG